MTCIELLTSHEENKVEYLSNRTEILSPELPTGLEEATPQSESRIYSIDHVRLCRSVYILSTWGTRKRIECLFEWSATLSKL